MEVEVGARFFNNVFRKGKQIKIRAKNGKFLLKIVRNKKISPIL